MNPELKIGNKKWRGLHIHGTTSYTLTAVRHQVCPDKNTWRLVSSPSALTLHKGYPAHAWGASQSHGTHRSVCWQHCGIRSCTTMPDLILVAKHLGATSLQGPPRNHLWPQLPYAQTLERTQLVYNLGWEAGVMFSAFPSQTVMTLGPCFCASDILNYPQVDGVELWTLLWSCEQRNRLLTPQAKKNASWTFGGQDLEWEELHSGSLDGVPSSATASFHLQVTSQPNASTLSPLLLPGFPRAVGIQHFQNSDPWNQVRHRKVIRLHSTVRTTHQGFMAIKSFSIHRSIHNYLCL